MAPEHPAAEGLLVVDKPAGQTSHDVVAAVRRLAGTRRVGHAGTLDPMATGVLVIGLGRATRLLGHLALTDKDYLATIRLGSTTDTDDAEGRVLTTTDPSGVTDAALAAAVEALTGTIMQTPPVVSAIRVDGQRAYTRARRGEVVEIRARRVEVTSFNIEERQGALIVARVTCSSGTYIRALARDLGAALGVGGHLAALRRTRVGPFRDPLPLALPLPVVELAEAVAAGFPARSLSPDEVNDVRHGRPISATGKAGTVGAFSAAGEVLALLTDNDGRARPVVVFAPA
ncbi:MAG: tRNA pseudouridine(55) synthase TruB [Mycobacteriales bacterium]